MENSTTTKSENEIQNQDSIKYDKNKFEITMITFDINDFEVVKLEETWKII